MTQIVVDIKDATKTLLKGFESLSEKKIQLSVMRAINGALGKTQTQMIRAVYERYNMKSQIISDQVEVFKASPANAYSGNIHVFNKQFKLTDFNPKEVNDGVATGRFSRTASYEKKNVKGLRANNKLVTQGLVVQIIRGQTKVIPSAYLSFKSDMSKARSSAKGQYNHGFNFDPEQGAKTLRTVSVLSMIQNEGIEKRYTETAKTEYSRQLYNELRKRLRGVGESNARF